MFYREAAYNIIADLFGFKGRKICIRQSNGNLGTHKDDVLSRKKEFRYDQAVGNALPKGLYVRPDHVDTISPVLAHGWLNLDSGQPSIPEKYCPTISSLK